MGVIGEVYLVHVAAHGDQGAVAESVPLEGGVAAAEDARVGDEAEAVGVAGPAREVEEHALALAEHGEDGHRWTDARRRERHHRLAADREGERVIQIPALEGLLRRRVQKVVAVVHDDLRAKPRASVRYHRDGRSHDSPSSPTADRATTAGECREEKEPAGRTTFAQRRNEASQLPCPKSASSVLI